MKTLKSIFAALVILTFATPAVFAQTSASATAETSATIITPIKIEKIAGADLNFGNIVPSSNPGSVVIAPDGTPTYNNGVVAFANNNGNPTAAQFTVTGAPDATYSITVPASPFNITRVNGEGETMSVGAFVTNPNGTGTLTGGTQTLQVGATLSVGANQEPGLYENTEALEITVAYN